MIWPISFIALVLAAAYFRTSHIIWTTGIAAFIFLFDLYGNSSAVTTTAAWVLFSAIFVPLNIYPLRRVLLSKHIYGLMAKIMPKISRTEQEALDAGDVWWEADLFSGKPDFSKIHNLPKPALNEKEQAFLDGPVDQLCSMLNDWQITHDNFDLPPDTWQFIKDNGFFAMIIPEEYGGLGFSAYAHSEVVMKIGSRSGSAAVTVMVPNSLGPGKLLMTYGTDEQKNYYLPRLARGEEIPCFALTGPSAGSDAGAMPDTGVVCYGSFDGKENVLGIRLNWEKRYITLAPVATLLGLAFKLHDPEHLLGEEEDRGITLALIKRETKGVEIGRRHFPLNQAFMNGPVRGKDVFIPIDWIIGGSDYVGKGWSMLMECLSDGRAISLPALGVAGGKMTSKFTGAYARIRKQFHTPIGYFEGIEEPLAEIGGQTYAMESARLLVLSCLDNGETPSVISGIVKQQLMQRMRTTVNHAMDIHGGHGICMGPNNYLARYYQLIPVGITVEGANILTRSLMIFGQGAMRSHPYLLKEVSAVHNSDKRQGLKDFDRALFAHAGFVMSNIVRSLWIGLTSAHLLLTPGRGITKYYYRQLVRLSSCFALMTDVCVGLLGGSLKRREKISGRFADALSNMYVLTATIKHFEDDGRPDEDIALLKWACDDALFNVQQAMKGIMVNLQIPLVGRILNMLVFPLSKPYQKPGDNLGHQVARLLLQPSATLDRLTGGIYTNKNPDDPTGRILLAQDLVLETADIERSIRVARRSNVLQSDDVGLYAEAREKNIINDEEFELLEQTRLAVQNAIKVDEFSNINWKVETPVMAKKDVYIVDGSRSPQLKAQGRQGPFSASDLAVQSARPLRLRNPAAFENIDEVILGCMMPSPDEANIARVISLRLGIPQTVPAWTVQRNCASGMQSIDSAFQNIRNGLSDIVLAGGVEAMSRAPVLLNDRMVNWLGDMATTRSPFRKIQQLFKLRPGHLKPVIALLRGLTDPVVGLSMGQTAEEIAYRFNISRTRMDEFAVASHQRLAQAYDGHRMDEVEVLYDQNGNYYDHDDGLRRDSSIARLTRLRPAFDRKYGNVTAGNSAQITDGASWLILASEKAVKKYNLTSLAKISDTQWAGLDPKLMGMGPVHAMTPIMQRNKLAIEDIDYWEINEAFAAQVLGCVEAWKQDTYCREHLNIKAAMGEIPHARLNIDGGGISLGHPVGASGARIVLHLANILKTHNARRGIASLCIGGGQGGAMLIERDNEAN